METNTRDIVGRLRRTVEQRPEVRGKRVKPYQFLLTNDDYVAACSAQEDGHAIVHTDEMGTERTIQDIRITRAVDLRIASCLACMTGEGFVYLPVESWLSAEVV